MSDRYEGGFIKAVPDTTDDYNAPGVWTLEQALAKQKAGVWPPSRDPYFNQTTLLLHGNGADLANNNTFLDSSSNTFPITRNGNTTQGTFSPFSAPDGRWSVSFPGSSYLTVPDNAVFEMSGDFTVEAYFYLNEIPASTTFADIVTKGASGIYQPYYIFVNSSAQLLFYSSSNGTSWNVASAKVFGTVSVGQWYHVAVSRSGSSLRMFLNGALIDTIINSDSLTNNTRAVGIGGRSDGTEDDIKGYISNVRIVKGRAVYTSAFTPETTPLGATSGGQNPPQGTETSLLTCQSNRFIDNGGLATPNTITVNGTPSITPFSPFAPTDAYDASVNGGSGYFDGADTSYLTDIGSVSDFNFIHNTSGLCTIEAWIYITSLDDTVHVIAMNNRNTSNIGFQFLVVSSTKNLSFRIVKGTNSVYGLVATGTTALNLNEWIHVCVEWDYVSDAGTMYINGEVETTFSADNTPFSDSNATATLRIGNNTLETDNFSWNGYISNLRISNSIVYGGAFIPSTEPLTTTSQSATNVELLLNFTNAGIFDNTGKNNLETVANAQVDTSVVKYGTGAMKFDGTDDYLLLKDNENFIFGTGDFTIEFWVYSGELTTSTIDPNFIDFRPTSTNGVYPSIFYDASESNLVFYVSTANRIDGGALSENTWYHIAVARAGTSTKMFVNGSQVGSTYTDTNDYLCGTNRPIIGAQGYNSTNVDRQLNGFIDDLRITKGVARYTANFTPPTGQLLSR